MLADDDVDMVDANAPIALVDVAVGEGSRPPVEEDGVSVADAATREALPLKSVAFDVQIEQGFADFRITQLYENPKDAALEILMKMPHSESFSLSKIEATFMLEDGTTKVLETKIEARQKAEAKYEDAVASGQTAVMATLPPVTRFKKNFVTFQLGNFPPRSRLVLRAFCSQKLDVEDFSYVFRIPLAYVPAYLGSVDTDIRNGVYLLPDSDDPAALGKKLQRDNPSA